MSEPITPEAVESALIYADSAKMPGGAKHQAIDSLMVHAPEGGYYGEVAATILAAEVRRLRDVIASRDEDGREV